MPTTIVYHGGEIIPAVQVQPVYFGTAWTDPNQIQSTRTQLDQYFQFIVNSGYMDLLAQYGVGHGSVLPSVVLTVSGTNRSPLSDGRIESILNQQILNGTLAPPSSSTLYAVFAGPNVIVTAGGGNSVQDFLGYHNSFTASNGANVVYSVESYPSHPNAQIPDLTAFQQLTVVASHELSEAVTDPNGDAWFADDANQDEIGDLANDLLGTYGGYAVQGEFSNQAKGPVLPADSTTTSTAAAADTTTILSVSPIQNVLSTTPITFAATVSASSGAVPTGVVTFQSGNQVLGSVTLQSQGSSATATLTQTLASGSYTITATYSPDTSAFNGSVSRSQPLAVSASFLSAPTTTTVTPQVGSGTQSLFAVGADAGGSPVVDVYNADGSLKFGFYAYDQAFTGGVRVAVADINGDGVPDIITAPGNGGGPEVRVFSGVDGSVLGGFYAYNPAFTGGLYVAAGRVGPNGVTEIITGAGPGGGPEVKVFDGLTGRTLPGPLGDFFAYDPNFRSGVTVAAGDYEGVGHDDLITGPGFGGGPQLKVWRTDGSLAANFFALDPNFRGGLNVAAADLTGDGKAELIIGAGGGGAPELKVFEGGDLRVLDDFYAYSGSLSGGLHVGSVVVNGRTDILTGLGGPTGSSEVKILDGLTGNLVTDFLASGISSPGAFVS